MTDPGALRWRKSTYSSEGPNCVELAEVGETVAVRNSNHPDTGMLVCPRAGVGAFLRDVKAGELDDL